MKHTIIACDLCNDTIYKSGYFRHSDGAISIRAKELKWLKYGDFDFQFDAPTWLRREYHVCPKCVEKIKTICCGGNTDENA